MGSILEAPSARRRDEFLAGVARSKELHRHWVSAPSTKKAFTDYIEQLRKPSYVSYWVCTEAHEIAGVINISEIVWGRFRSGYLGYYALVPHNGRGYMSTGVRAVVSRAFRTLRLHRLEANLQPDNAASRKLVESLGFRQEGFSRRYLKINGLWRDHERWALTVEEWR
jgi:ribosomal-protein-alanine N-acetyltransferase